MKVLFVDDEPLTRQELRGIISWIDYGFTEFFEAEDGVEGLRLIEKENPELILLDIHMEKMTGLEMARTARENDYTGKIIIISGCSDFSYARQAITYDVTAYLLKPVNPEALTEAVLKSLDELHKEKFLSVYCGQPAHLTQKRILADILLGYISYTPDIKMFNHLNLHSDYYRLISLCLPADYSGNAPRNKLIAQLSKHCLSIRFSETELSLLVLNVSQELSVRKSLSAYWEEYPMDQSFLAILSPLARTHTELSSLYAANQSIRANLYYYKERQSPLISADALKLRFDNIQRANLNLIAFTEKLLQQIILLQSPEIHETARQLLDYLSMRHPPRDSVGFILLNGYIQIVSCLTGYYPQLEFELADKGKFAAHLYTDQYLCDSIYYLNQQLQKAVTFIKTASLGNPCERICQYIDTNFAAPLKLEDIADLMGYNSAYLGKLFAQETGEHFKTYLDKVRIRNARIYLEKGASVAKACELSGIANPDYFTKKFKKYVGLLPSEYRRLHAESPSWPAAAEHQ